MKYIPLQEAFAIIQDASAIIIDDTLTFPCLDDLNGSDENEFLYLGWEIEDLEYCAKFQEGENKMVRVSGSNLFLIDNEGEETQITILVPAKL
jgi:hypothetical protein